MEKSNIEKIKELVLYAPVGAFGFVKDNTPTFFNMFVSRGRRDVNKSAMSAEEKLSLTKEKGQFVAMGTPIAKDKAEVFANQAKEKGESFTNDAFEIAGAALSVVEGFIQDVLKNVVPDENNSENKKTEASSEPTRNENATLPKSISNDYDSLSAPEIIDKLDSFNRADLLNIQKYEAGFRNRQTIIHAVAYRLNS